MKGKDKGYALLETLVALTILTISLVTIISSFSRCLDAHSRLQDITKGLFFAQMKIEEILKNESIKIKSQEGYFEDKGIKYNWRQKVIPTQISTMKEVEICVFWYRRGEKHTIRMTTLISKN